MPSLNDLQAAGQSVWLDYIDRDLLSDGGLAALVADGVTGVTSNPTIFAKAIGEGGRYDQAIADAPPAASPEAIASALMIEDIRNAADTLANVYESSGGDDGYVSLEVPPGLAHDTAHTISTARRLWREVARPNLMIKVPGTKEGLKAVELLVAEGINVNVTLLFSLRRYRSVVKSYVDGIKLNPEPGGVRSVASFFVSRVDTKIDALLDQANTPEALVLRGRAAIANATLAYAHFREVFDGEEFQQQVRRGAKLQRLLWASTGTKNASYSDVLYVDSLVGADTVNTMPPKTMNAWRDHGRAATRLPGDEADARATWAALKSLGIDTDAVMEQLEEEGVEAFARSYRQLVDTVAAKSAQVQAS